MSWRSSERRRSALALSFLASGLAGLAAAGGCGDASEGSAPPGAAAAERRPGVLLLTLDTTRADALGVYGQERPTTPHLDRLARGGVLFEQAYASAPTTLPSHTTILTGRMPFAHGVRSNGGYRVVPELVTLAEVFADHGYVTAAEIAAPVLGRDTGIDQGFDHFRDVDAPDVTPTEAVVHAEGGEPRRISLRERSAADVSRRAVEHLARFGDRPFFLWLHYFDPHRIYAAPPPWRGRFPESPYHEEVAYMDAQVGLVLEALAREGLADSTLVVAVGDHGEGLGEHGEPTHSFGVYDTTMRVPLAFAWPGELPAGRRVAAPVRTADVAPTVLELAGLPPLRGVQGVSLAPTLRGADPPALAAYGESLEAHDLFGASSLRFLRRGRWKLLHKTRPALYDVVADPGEREDRAGEEPERVAALVEELVAWVRAEAAVPGDARRRLDDETRDRLVALGYAGAEPAAGFDDAADVASPSGPDPNALADDQVRYADAHASLTWNRYDEATERFAALALDYPESDVILDYLVRSAEAADRPDLAVPALRRAVEVRPEALDLYAPLGRGLLAQGRLAEAERLLRAGLAREPCESALRVLLATALDRAGRTAEQLAVLAQGIEACALSADVRNDYAYVRATAPDPALRDGAEALRVARAVVAEAGEQPHYLDTLACAYAATGAFERAAALVGRALAQLEAAGAPEEVLALYRDHRDRFARGEAVVEGGSSRP